MSASLNSIELSYDIRKTHSSNLYGIAFLPDVDNSLLEPNNLKIDTDASPLVTKEPTVGSAFIILDSREKKYTP